MRLKPLLEYAFAKLGRDRVVAITHPENRASIRLAERIGMVNERKVLWKGKAALPILREGLALPSGGPLAPRPS